MRSLTNRKIFLASLMLAMAFSVFWIASSANTRKQDESSRRIESSRSALEKAITKLQQNPTVQTQTKAGKAHKAYQDAVGARINEILKRLKELGKKVETPKSEGTTDSEAFVQASAAAFEKSGIKEEYLALQAELAGLYDSMEEFSRSIAGFQTQGLDGGQITGPGCPPEAITNTLGGTSPDFPSATGTQTGRLTLNGVQSACNLVKGCPGPIDSTPRVFDQYQFVNTGCANACVMVTLNMTSGQCGSNLAVAAYLTGYNPASICTNYLGDPGSSAANNGEVSTPATFAVNVPAQTGFVIIVYEVTAGAGSGCPYTLNVSGLCQPCQITCPANITVSNDPNQCGAVVNYPAPATCGNCGTITCSPASGSFFPVGTTTITCTTTAGPSCTFTITVIDTQPPSITCPSNVTAVAAPTCPPAASVAVSFPAPTASDNCPGVVTACNPPSGSTIPVGSTTVTCTATDATGNVAVCFFSVTVFNACIQDDSNPTSVILFNTFTGQFRACCNGVVYTGVGTVNSQGCDFTLQSNSTTFRVTAKWSSVYFRGSGSVQAPPGTTRCVLTDRDIRNNTCTCQ